MTAPDSCTLSTRCRAALRPVVLAAAGVALLVLAAKVKVPFWPVPVTLQTLTVVCLAALYGCRVGAATVALYLLLGAAGLPVFAATPERGIGIAYMMGPTGGYLAGFFVAAMAVGALADRGWTRRAYTAGLAASAGTLVIMGLGYLRLSALVGPEQALQTGVLPFVPAEAAKIVVATLVLPAMMRLRG